MKLRNFYILFILLISLAGWFKISADVPDFELNRSLNKISLNSHIEIFEDKSAELKFKDILSRRNAVKFTQKDTNSFGYTNSIYWVRFKVKNTERDVMSWMLELNYSPFDLIELFHEESGDKPVFRGGDILPFDTRVISYRNVVFPLREKPDSKRFYFLKLKTISSMTIPLFAYSEKEFFKKVTNEQIILGIFYGSMAVMFIYNLFLFLATRDMSYLYYILYIAGNIFFQATLYGLSFQYLWPDNVWWANQSLPVFMLFTILSGLIFSYFFLNARVNTPKTSLLYFPLMAYTFLGIFASFFMDYSTSILLAIIPCFPAVTLAFVNGFQCLFSGQRSARFFLIAWAIFLVGVLLYASKALGFVPDNPVTTWAIQIGAAVEVVLLSLALADRINELSRNLSLKVSELNTARSKIEASEKKFRNLFESQDDFMFTLDEDWNFQSANKALTTYIGFQPGEVIGKYFIDFIYASDEFTDEYNKIFAREKLAELSSTGKSVHLQAEFGQKHVMEPMELLVDLQILEHNDKREILGKAYSPFEDIPFKFLNLERTVFTINNYIQNVEPLSQKLTKNLVKYTDANSTLAIKYSLREIIINAIEHGNLNISFDEKTKAMEDGEYFMFVQTRQKDPLYRNKKVVIEYTLNHERVGFRITDEGEGFDHQKMIKTDVHKLFKDKIHHGRGILLTMDAFDAVKYNQKGNQVVLIKYF